MILSKEEKREIESMPYEEPTHEKITYGKPLFGNIYSISVDWPNKRIEINGVEIEIGTSPIKGWRKELVPNE